MFVGKFGGSVFSWYLRFEIRFFALSPTILGGSKLKKHVVVDVDHLTSSLVRF